MRIARPRTVPRDTPVGRMTTVTRHPLGGREVSLIGTARLRDRSVLDIGSGDGRLSFGLARVARTVFGIDPSPEAVAGAAARARALGLSNVGFAVGAAQSLDLGRRRFDVAVFTWSL